MLVHGICMFGVLHSYLDKFLAVINQMPMFLCPTYNICFLGVKLD